MICYEARVFGVSKYFTTFELAEKRSCAAISKLDFLNKNIKEMIAQEKYHEAIELWNKMSNMYYDKIKIIKVIIESQ